MGVEKKNEIPTAEELATQLDEEFKKDEGYYQSNTEPRFFAARVALKFAKLHVEAAMKAILESGKKMGLMNDADLDYLKRDYPIENIE